MTQKVVTDCFFFFAIRYNVIIKRKSRKKYALNTKAYKNE